jgi:SecD/SecF fusion protein
MLRRLIVFAVVLATALLLLFLQNKVLVGEQELQALLQLEDKPGAPSEAEHAYKLVFSDLGGNGVPTTTYEREQVLARLAGNSRVPALAVKVSEITAEHALVITAPAGVSESDLKHRLQGVPFKRSNPPRSLFHIGMGIDISGGVEFICELRNENGVRVAANDEVMHVLRKRLDTRGLTEPVVTKLSNGDVQVVIPGGTVADAARTRKVLEDTGRLEFREVLEDYGTVTLGAPEQKVVERPNGGFDFAPGVYHNRSDIVAPKRVDPGFTPTQFYRLGKAELTGKDVADASQELEQGEPAVAISFTAIGSTRNEAFTTRLYATGPQHGNHTGTGCLAILFDGVVQSAPYVENPSSSRCQIHGNFTQDEIDRLRTSLQAGSLAVKPQVLSERVVGATLGAETVNRAMFSMAASFVLIVLFMAVYYRRLGTVANLCLVVTGMLIYATLSVFGATVTLPGLAGLVLTIGMAVDTNILVFERIREELREEKGLQYAIAHGYDRAFLTIVDAHLTTFITALILYYIGSGPVKGFGLSLMIGIAINLFSGIYIGRLFTDWLCRGRQTLSLASWVPALRLPYVGWRHIGYAFSIITGVLGAGWFAFGHLIMHDSFERNFDIDFTGGNMVQVIFKEAKDLTGVERAITAAHDEKPVELNLLKELRMQPYVANIGDDAAKSRQWVFRGRDEAGSRLEAQRDVLEEGRVALQKQSLDLRNLLPPKEAEARAVDKEIEARAKDIQGLQSQIAARTAAFKQQLAAAFPGQLAKEGDEVISAAFQDTHLTLRVATLQAPDLEQVQHLASVLAKRDEIASCDVKPLAAPLVGLEINATYRQKPSATAVLEESDPVLTRLQEQFAAAPAAAPAPAGAAGAAAPPAAAPAADLVKGEARAAFELYNAAATQAGKERVTVAKPFPSTEHFSGQVAGRMKWLALLAVVLSFIAILAYVAARFEFRFGIGAVVALVHDVILTVGLISIVGVRIDLTVIAAVLTIIGYSINGTIVTFDRIRENIPKLRLSLAEVIDISIAQTMQRTVLTSGTVIITAAILFLFGGDALRPFTATLLIGLTLGTYSSVFVSAPLLMTFTRKGASLAPLLETAPVGAIGDGAEAAPGSPSA